jgi:hypothetical protein
LRGEPISAFHGVLARIGREQHARRINRIANDPSVYPLVKAHLDGMLDFTFAVQDHENTILLMSQHGGILFSRVSPGIYEAHPMVLPEGRGKWAGDLGRAAMHWMFTRTDCLEILAPAPVGNPLAGAYARSLKMRPAFLTAPYMPLDGKLVPVQVYAMTLQEWIEQAPGLVERGEWVEHTLNRLGLRLTEQPDAAALSHIGLTFECFLNGAVPKGVVFHGRWAKVSGYQPCQLVSIDPPAIAFKGGTVVIQDHQRFYVIGDSGASLH